MSSLEWNWSLSLGSSVRVLSIAREAELLLALLVDSTLALVDGRGELQARTKLNHPTCACISEDGSAILGGSDLGHLFWLSADLSIKSDERIGAPLTAVAIDSFGRYVAVSDRKGGLQLRDHTGREIGRQDCPRPPRHLAFVLERPLLVTAADFGWAGCLDLATGDWVWSDRPVSNIGGLAVAGSGDPLVLACFSDGLRRYGPGGSPRSVRPMPSPCGLVAISFAGTRGVCAGVAPQLCGFDTSGDLVFTESLDEPPTALVMSALGDRLFLGGPDGTLRAATWKTQ